MQTDTNKKMKDTQVLNVQPQVKGINYTLRDMLGIPYQLEH